MNGDGQTREAQADLQRDRRLRRRLLVMLHESRGNSFGGWVSAQYLFDMTTGFAPAQERPRDDRHLVNLLRDLVSGGYATERDERERASQPFSAYYLSFRITHGGSGLITEALPPDAQIEDDRNA